MAKRNSSKELSGGCLSLFGLPFLAAGLFMSGLYFSGYSQWWARAELGGGAVLDRIRGAEGEQRRRQRLLQGHRHLPLCLSGPRPVTATGFPSTAARTTSAVSNRRPTASSPPMSGNEARRCGDRSAAGRARPFRCYVNPEKPSESVLYRTLRWEMQAFMAIFALTFPAVGAGLVAGGVMSTLASRKEAALRKQHPGEPWKWKPQWSGNSIPEKRDLMARRAPSLHDLVRHHRIHAGRERDDERSFSVGWHGLAAVGFRGAVEHSSLVFDQTTPPPPGGGNHAFRTRGRSPVWPGGVMEGAILMQRPLPMRLSTAVST